MARRLDSVGVILFAIGVFSVLHAGEMTFDDRVKAQQAIEDVYWRHRVWPKENVAPKPARSAVMSDSAVRAKVESYLAMSSALESLWHRPIRSEQLQAELDRMSRSSRDGAILRELFAALDNDPARIAETLARQTLAERLVRDLYATDDRFHGELRARAESELVSCDSVDCLGTLGPGYRESTFTLAKDDALDLEDAGTENTILLDRDEWKDRLERIESLYGRPIGVVPLRTLSGLEEISDGFVVTAILSRRADAITIATKVWPKIPFDTWWDTEHDRFLTLADSTAFVFSLPVVLSTECTPDAWSPTVIPGARFGLTAVWTGAEMIVWGGNDDYSRKDGARYNPATDSWAPMSTGAGVPQARAFHTAVWTGKEMIVWGGVNSAAGAGSTYLNSGGRYDPSTDSWEATSLGENLPETRRGHFASWTGTEMIVWGGHGEVWRNGGGRYDPASDTWAPMAPGDGVLELRSNPAVAWTGTELIVWGGAKVAPPSTYLNTGGRYDPVADSWSLLPMAGSVPVGRSEASAVWTGTEMIVWGGSGNRKSGGRFNPATGTWTATSEGANVPAGRDSHTAQWTGTEMIVWGGDASANFLNTGGRYNPVTDSWTQTSTGANVPTRRYRHAAVWTGAELIIWGGQDSAGSTNTGARYDPATDTWAPTSTGGIAPTGRVHHSAVWTGTEMIVWGGNGSTSYTNTGGRYIPATDTWFATSGGAGTPSPRTSHGTVWTGTEMIVWGGFDGSLNIDTGGRYNPATDMWSAVSVAGAPQPRSRPSAIWTGTEMIVWGGYDGSATVNSGGRYNPSTNSWTPTSTGANVPMPRHFHTAIWTGNEMVVWGGSNTCSCLPTNGGGRYSPTLDAWLPTSLVNAPDARALHTAVWTGSRMIVWGGRDASDELNTGAAYDSATDAWTPTSTGTNVPAARMEHTAVWTGTEMIVWGGSGVGILNSGARYSPSLDIWSPTSRGTGVPTGRYDHNAVWTGTEMIIWGGTGSNLTFRSDMGSYCAPECISPSTYFKDSDGDGYGTTTVSISACHLPPGYADDASDCDDADANTFPGAPEIKDGKDNQCPTDCSALGGACGFGTIDEISAPILWNGSTLHWTAQAGATAYQVVRSSDASFTADCLTLETTESSYMDDLSVPLDGACYFYLVRSLEPLPAGSWGQNSGGTERSGACLSR